METLTEPKNSAAVPRTTCPRIGLLTRPDDASFCHKVSAALEQGYQLNGSPAAAFNGERVIVAQAVTWPTVQA